MKARITGLGCYYPEKVLTNRDWPEDFGKAARSGGDRTFNDIPVAMDEAERITARHVALEAADPFLGCETRHLADEDMTSAEAEARAARAALAQAGIGAADVDAVVSYAMVPDVVAPHHACKVAHLIGAERATAWGLDTACAAVIVQLATAAGLIEAGIARTVLLTQSHLLLRAMPRLHPAVPGLGDGATACVVRGEGQGLQLVDFHAVTHGEFFDAVAWVRPDSTEQRWWKTGGDYRLGSRDPAGAKRLMRDTVSFGAKTVREVCDKAGTSPEGIDVFACVMPRGWIPPSILEVLGVAPERAVTTYRRTGHLGGAGPIANLCEARDRGLLRPGALVAMYAQGAGFTRGAALLRAT